MYSKVRNTIYQAIRQTVESKGIGNFNSDIPQVHSITKCRFFYADTTLHYMSFFLRRHSTHYDSTLFIYADTTLTTIQHFLSREIIHSLIFHPRT